ncbi:type IV secretory system conjugative DNA transfer family protein, partial [Streptococcus suis]
SILEVLFDDYAKKYGHENFTMRKWADFQNYKDKTLDSVIAVTTSKFALFNIQSVIDLTQRDTMDLKTWGTQKTMDYLVNPDKDTTF